MIRYFARGTDVVFTIRDGRRMVTVTCCDSVEDAERMAAGLQAKFDRLTAAQQLHEHRLRAR